jgi:hypothetical protein
MQVDTILSQELGFGQKQNILATRLQNYYFYGMNIVCESLKS